MKKERERESKEEKEHEEERSRGKESTAAINILRNFHSWRAKVDRSREFKSRLNPDAKTPLLKRDVLSFPPLSLSHSCSLSFSFILSHTRRCAHTNIYKLRNLHFACNSFERESSGNIVRRGNHV